MVRDLSSWLGVPGLDGGWAGCWDSQIAGVAQTGVHLIVVACSSNAITWKRTTPNVTLKFPVRAFERLASALLVQEQPCSSFWGQYGSLQVSGTPPGCGEAASLSSVGITISYPVVYTEMVLTSLSRQWKVHLQELIGSSLLNKVGPTPYTTHFTTPSTHRPRAISTSLALQCKTALRTQSLPQPPLPHKPFAPFGYNFKHYDTIHLMTSGSSNAVGGKNPWRVIVIL